MVAPAHHVAVNRMEIEVLEVVGTRHDLGTTRRAVDPGIARARIKVPVVVIDKRRDVALGILLEHLGPYLKIGLDVLLRSVLVEAILDGIRLIGVVTAAQVLVLEHPIDHGALLVSHQTVTGRLFNRTVVLDLRVDARVKTVVLLNETRRLLERNREDFAFGAGRDVVRRHKHLGEVHIRDKAEREHREDADPAETRRGARGLGTRLLGCAMSDIYIPSAKRSRNHACRQRKHKTTVAQKRGTHGTQRKQQPVVARKEHGGFLARSLDIGITTGQATRNELDGLYQQHQKRVCKEHVFGEQRRVVREHRHKRKEQQDRTADRQAHAQLAQRRNGIGHAGGRDYKLSAGIDGKARIGIVEQRKPQLNARADNGRVHHGMMSVEQHIGVEQAQVIARAVGIVEPLTNLRAGVSHKKTGQRGDERGRPGNYEHQEGPGKGML